VSLPIATESVEWPRSKATQSRVRTDGLSSLKPIRVKVHRADSPLCVSSRMCSTKGHSLAKARSNSDYSSRGAQEIA